MNIEIVNSTVNIMCGGGDACSSQVNYSMGLPSEPGRYVIRMPVAILPGRHLVFETARARDVATESGEFVWVIDVVDPQESFTVTGCGAVGSPTIEPYVVDEP